MEPSPIIAICIIIAVIAGCCFVRWWNKYETERKNKNKKEKNRKEVEEMVRAEKRREEIRKYPDRYENIDFFNSDGIFWEQIVPWTIVGIMIIFFSWHC